MCFSLIAVVEEQYTLKQPADTYRSRSLTQAVYSSTGMAVIAFLPRPRYSRSTHWATDAGTTVMALPLRSSSRNCLAGRSTGGGEGGRMRGGGEWGEGEGGQ